MSAFERALKQHSIIRRCNRRESRPACSEDCVNSIAYSVRRASPSTRWFRAGWWRSPCRLRHRRAALARSPANTDRSIATHTTTTTLSMRPGGLYNMHGDSSFSAAGPRLWNDLPPGLRRPGLTFDSFRQSLRTHLFGDRSA